MGLPEGMMAPMRSVCQWAISAHASQGTKVRLRYMAGRWASPQGSGATELGPPGFHVRRSDATDVCLLSYSVLANRTKAFMPTVLSEFHVHG